MKNIDKTLITQLRNMGCKFQLRRKKITGGKIGNLFYIVFPNIYSHCDIFSKVKEFYKKSQLYGVVQEDKIVINIK